MSPSRLEDRVSLVDRNINFTTDMSVRQTILFHSLMREPGTLTRGRDTKGRVSVLSRGENNDSQKLQVFPKILVFP